MRCELTVSFLLLISAFMPREPSTKAIQKSPHSQEGGFHFAQHAECFLDGIFEARSDGLMWCTFCGEAVLYNGKNSGFFFRHVLGFEAQDAGRCRQESTRGCR